MGKTVQTALNFGSSKSDKFKKIRKIKTAIKNGKKLVQDRLSQVWADIALRGGQYFYNQRSLVQYISNVHEHCHLLLAVTSRRATGLQKAKVARMIPRFAYLKEEVPFVCKKFKRDPQFKKLPFSMPLEEPVGKYNDTELHNLVKQRNLEGVKQALQEKKENPFKRNFLGLNALDLAVVSEQKEIADFLRVTMERLIPQYKVASLKLRRGNTAINYDLLPVIGSYLPTLDKLLGL